MREVLAVIAYFVVAFPMLCHSFVIQTVGSIDTKGNNETSDSFDSTDPNCSTNGLYYGPRRRAGGDIIANGGITNSAVSVGNAQVAGHIFAPAWVWVAIGPYGSVGDLMWITNQTGIKPGWWRNDVSVSFPDVVLPPGPWTTVGPATPSGLGGPGTVNGTAYGHVFTVGGYFSVTDSGAIYVGTNTSVQILTSNSLPTTIYVAGTDAGAGRLRIFLAASTATIRATHVSQSGRAINLQFYGLASCTTLTYTGTGDFAGLIYAPQADFHLAGGGSSSANLFGSFLTKTLSVNGQYNFHADESLAAFLPVPPMLSSPSSVNDGFQLNVEGVGGIKYAVESSSNLTDWTAIVTNQSPFTFLDTNVVADPQRFYRAVSVR